MFQTTCRARIESVIGGLVDKLSPSHQVHQWATTRNFVSPLSCRPVGARQSSAKSGKSIDANIAYGRALRTVREDLGFRKGLLHSSCRPRIEFVRNMQAIPLHSAPSLAKRPWLAH